MKHSAKAAARQEKADHAAARTGTAPATARLRLAVQLPYWVVLAGVVAGLATIRGGGHAVRSGTLVIAGALLGGALMRAVLPQGRAGMLGSRRRLADVAALAVLGVGLLVAALIARLPG